MATDTIKRFREEVKAVWNWLLPRTNSIREGEGERQRDVDVDGESWR